MSATIAVSGLRATPVASTSRFTLGARPAARPAVIVRAVADVDETSFQAEAMEVRPRSAPARGTARTIPRQGT